MLYPRFKSFISLSAFIFGAFIFSNPASSEERAGFCANELKAVLASGGDETSGSRKLWAQRLDELFGTTNRIVVVTFAVDPQWVTPYLDLLSGFGLFEGRKIIPLSEIQSEGEIVRAVESAPAFFTLGGNTFRLVHDLHAITQASGHKKSLMKIIQERVRSGIPYAGVSAGSNLGGPTMKTTNDMPIIFPPSFETLGIVPFQINPHFLGGQAHYKSSDGQLHPHGGESREMRIDEFHELNKTPVVGIPENTILSVYGERVVFEAIDPDARAHLFMRGRTVQLLKPGTDVTEAIRSVVQQ